MKIVSRDYSIGQNTVQSKNETAKMSLYPKSYATQSQINANTNLANTISTISNVANTAYNTYEKINDINTKENEAQIEASGIYHNAVQALNSSATALNSNGQEEYTTWVNNPDGTRTPSASHRAVIDSFISEINNGSYTNDAKKYAINKLEGLYNDNVSSFSAKATQTNIELQNQVWSDTLDGYINQRSNAVSNKNYDGWKYSDSLIRNTLSQKYSGDALEAAYSAAIKQSDLKATYLEGNNIAVTQGVDKAYEFYKNLGSYNALSIDEVDAGIAKAFNSASQLNQAMTDKGASDANAILQAGESPVIGRRKGEKELADKGYSSQAIATYSASFVKTQRTNYLNKFSEFETKVNNCNSIEDLVLLSNELTASYPMAQGGVENEYNEFSKMIDTRKKAIINAYDDAGMITFKTALELYDSGGCNFTYLDNMARIAESGMTDADKIIEIRSAVRKRLTSDSALPTPVKKYYDHITDTLRIKAEELYPSDKQKTERCDFIYQGEQFIFGSIVGNDHVSSTEEIDRIYDSFISGTPYNTKIGAADSGYGYMTTSGSMKDLKAVSEEIYNDTSVKVFKGIDPKTKETVFQFAKPEYKEEADKIAATAGSYFEWSSGGEYKYLDENGRAIIYDFVQVKAGNGINSSDEYIMMPRVLSTDGTRLSWISSNGEEVWIDGRMEGDTFKVNARTKVAEFPELPDTASTIPRPRTRREFPDLPEGVSTTPRARTGSSDNSKTLSKDEIEEKAEAFRTDENTTVTKKDLITQIKAEYEEYDDREKAREEAKYATTTEAKDTLIFDTKSGELKEGEYDENRRFMNYGFQKIDAKLIKALESHKNDNPGYNERAIEKALKNKIIDAKTADMLIKEYVRW